MRIYFLYSDNPEHNNIEPTDELFLLGKFDPLFISYHHKDWIVSREKEKFALSILKCIKGRSHLICHKDLPRCFEV
jgi:calcineurin-like phosphoesterase family protein